MEKTLLDCDEVSTVKTDIEVWIVSIADGIGVTGMAIGVVSTADGTGVEGTAIGVVSTDGGTGVEEVIVLKKIIVEDGVDDGALVDNATMGTGIEN